MVANQSHDHVNKNLNMKILSKTTFHAEVKEVS